jgi:hypothetical protein
VSFRRGMRAGRVVGMRNSKLSPPSWFLPAEWLIGGQQRNPRAPAGRARWRRNGEWLRLIVPRDRHTVSPLRELRGELRMMRTRVSASSAMILSAALAAVRLRWGERRLSPLG